MKKPLLVFLTLAALGGSAYWLWRGRRADPESLRGVEAISVPSGFRVELASLPGVVAYPMLGTFDERGRLFMCSSSGQTMKTPEMSAAPNYEVTLLEDTNGDGVFDKSAVFAGNLTLPAGAVWLDGSLYVAAPPDLLRLTDADGDGRAEKREIVITGWNLSANAASLHGPVLGPDGWLYLTDGRHGYKIRTKEGKLLEGKASRIWRLRPDGSGLEWVSGGGFDNPVEVVFTPAGEIIGTMTYFTDPMNGQRDALLHFVEGGVYPKWHPVVDEFHRTGDLMPVMTRFARVAPAGLLRFSGGTFGLAYQGSLFSAHFNSHRVLRHVLERERATYTTSDEDFLVSSDPDFHPTDVIEAPDGSLIVVDTGAWFIHGCPLSRTAKPDIRGALYRVRAVQPKKAVQPSLTEQECAKVFAAFRSGKPEDRNAIRAALDAQEPDVRIAAARSLGMLRDKASVPRLMEMARREAPPVRRQAATALGQIGGPRAVAALLEAAANPEDRFVEHAVIYALLQLGKPQPLVEALRSSEPGVRKAALVALDQMEGGGLTVSQLLPFLTEEEAALRKAGLWVASRHPAWSASIGKVLEGRLRAASFGPGEETALGDALASFCADPAVQQLLGKTLGGPSLNADRQKFVLRTLEKCPSGKVSPPLVDGLRRALGHADASVRFQAVSLARALGLESLDTELLSLASNSSQARDVRIAALGAVAGRTASLDNAHFDFLADSLKSGDAAQRLSAAQVLGRARLNDSQLVLLARNYLNQADPLVLPPLFNAYRRTGGEEAGMALVRVLLDSETALGAVGGQTVEAVLGRFPPAVQRAAEPVLSRIAREKTVRLDRLRKLSAVLEASGDADRGRAIFFGAKAACSGCHTIGTEGGHVGPDLTSIGAIRSPHDLLEAIVLPSESFVPGHEVYRVETARDVFTGVLGSQSPEGVVLISGPNDQVWIARKDITKMEAAPVSLMPEGYDDVLSSRELADLLAYLKSQTSRPAG